MFFKRGTAKMVALVFLRRVVAGVQVWAFWARVLCRLLTMGQLCPVDTHL